MKELNIKVVPGHCQSFETREDVDAFIKMSQYISESGKPKKECKKKIRCR